MQFKLAIHEQIQLHHLKVWLQRFVVLSVLLFSQFAFPNTLETQTYANLKENPETNPTIKPTKAKGARSISENAKLGSFLKSFIANQKESRKDPNLKNTSLVRQNAQGKLQVYITLKSVDEIALSILEDAGVQIEVANKQLGKVQGWVSVEQIEGLSDLSNVDRVSIPSYALSKRGTTTSAGVKQLKANELAKLGHTGKGVRVGVVSNGANDWRSAAASGDLPQKVTVYGSCTKRSSNNSNQNLCSLVEASCNEGTAMAEIIHDIAPDAELAVAAVNTSLEFVSQIERLISEFKADIIVDDLGFLGEPSFYDGDIAKAIDGMSKKVLFISSAGNSGYGHYRSVYNRSKNYIVEPRSDGGYAVFVHDFDERANKEDRYHGFVIPANSASSVFLKWDGRVGYFSNNSFRLRIHNSNGEIIYSSRETIDSPEDAFVGACIPNTSNRDEVYFATVQLTTGDLETPFEMFFFGRGAIEYPFSPSSIFGHPALERVIAVGSINSERFSENKVAFYSSQGPVLINELNEFDTDVVKVIKRKKPDLIGVDGISVTGSGGFTNQFFGTSAAAPHIAGIAAQLMSVSPFVTAKNTHKALQLGARDIGPLGHDNKSGYGVADGLGALENLVLQNPMPGILMLLNDD